MSGQCLSASGAGRALTPARHLSLGEPLPHQLANITWTPPGPKFFRTTAMPPRYHAGNYLFVRIAMPQTRVGYPCLTAPFATSPHCWGFVRLACLIHAANVHSEPGSNPSVCIVSPAYRRSLHSQKTFELQFVAIRLFITHRTSPIPHHSTIPLRVSLLRAAY